jgi:hypothetical protein
LCSEGVEGQLPSAAGQVSGIAADSCGALFDELDGIEACAAVESAAVVGQAPWVNHLVGEESAGEGKG